MVSALILLAIRAQPETVRVADYFPTTPGAKWTYSDKIGRSSLSVTDQAGPTTVVGGIDCASMFSVIDGVKGDYVYYRVTEDEVSVAAFDPKKPLPSPYPILKSGKWKFAGQTFFLDDPVRMTLEGESRLLGNRKVLGQPVSVLEVRLKVSVEMGADTSLTSTQTSLYAKGIGLVEMRESGRIAKQTHTRTRKLESFEDGGRKTN